MYKLYWRLAVVAWLFVSTVQHSPDPSTTPADPTVTTTDPIVTPADPTVAAADPTVAAADPTVAAADPTVAPAGPDTQHSTLQRNVQEIAAVVRNMQYLMGEVIGHQQTAETLAKGIYARLEDIASRQQDVESQLEDIASRQQGVESQLEDIASRQEDMEAQQHDIVSRLESVETRQNFTTEKLASIAADTRVLVAPRDCRDLPPGSPSGVYQVRLTSAAGPVVDAFCNQTVADGGWTVFQRRADIQPRQDFYLTWEDYKLGFGSIDGGEFWWGLEKLRRMTSPSDRKFQLRIDLEDEDGNWGLAVYDNFRISSEADGYRLYASNFTGDVGDSLIGHVGRKFTTKDRDQDASSSINCAQRYEGAWWYSKCHDSHLNGRYKPGRADSTVVSWYNWRKNRKCLKTAEMKLRPM